MDDSLACERWENALVDKLGDALPQGWRVVDVPADRGFDVIAQSPDGNLFPIEVKGGTGRLDLSAVTRFGGNIDSTGAGLTSYLDEVEDPLVDSTRALNVKPVIVTSQELPGVAARYAERLHIEVVRPHVEVQEFDAEGPYVGRRKEPYGTSMWRFGQELPLPADSAEEPAAIPSLEQPRLHSVAHLVANRLVDLDHQIHDLQDVSDEADDERHDWWRFRPNNQ